MNDELSKMCGLKNILNRYYTMWIVFKKIYSPSVILSWWSSVPNGIRLQESIVRHLHNLIYDFADNLFRHIKKKDIIFILFPLSLSFGLPLCCSFPLKYTNHNRHMLHIWKAIKWVCDGCILCVACSYSWCSLQLIHLSLKSLYLYDVLEIVSIFHLIHIIFAWIV